MKVKDISMWIYYHCNEFFNKVYVQLFYHFIIFPHLWCDAILENPPHVAHGNFAEILKTLFKNGYVCLFDKAVIHKLQVSVESIELAL